MSPPVESNKHEKSPAEDKKSEPVEDELLTAKEQFKSQIKQSPEKEAILKITSLIEAGLNAKEISRKIEQEYPQLKPADDLWVRKIAGSLVLAWHMVREDRPEIREKRIQLVSNQLMVSYEQVKVLAEYCTYFPSDCIQREVLVEWLEKNHSNPYDYLAKLIRYEKALISQNNGHKEKTAIDECEDFKGFLTNLRREIEEGTFTGESIEKLMGVLDEIAVEAGKLSESLRKQIN